MPNIIVIGNEKGGSGKTTTAMHLIVSLLKLGFTVGSIDLDSRQQSLTRYINNRADFAKKANIALEAPDHRVVKRSAKPTVAEIEAEESQNFEAALAELKHNDFIVIDTPGSDAYLSRVAHSHADTVITPINDSFVDVDLLGYIDAEKLEVVRPGIYSAMVWEQKLKRASRDKGEINWVVVRNRLAAIDARNKRRVEEALLQLAKKFGFGIAPGFGDRVVFKELFLHGLTLHDAMQAEDVIKLTPSVIAARQELREFVRALEIPELKSFFVHNDEQDVA
jgi:chromosome partitioning protein